MIPIQPGIFADLPPLARYLTFTLKTGTDPRANLKSLASLVDGQQTVIGLGECLTLALGAKIEPLRTFPVMSGPGVAIPSTPAALWLWLRGDDRGELVHRTRRIQLALADSFATGQVIDAFLHRKNRDLSGYEDGTENPQGDERTAATALQDAGEGLDGSSFVAAQQWVHDFSRLEAMSPERQDDTIGRRKTDNEEFEEAPDSSHVKRTAQESFDPEAFVWRRSMPWADSCRSGFYFVAFGRSFDAFEAQLIRMAGLEEDGITDALFHFTLPVTGAYFWCPPMKDGKPDLRAVGL